MRINARLDEARAEKLRFLRETTDATITGVVEQAIDRYYDEVCKARSTAAPTLRRHGFVAGFDADPDLAGEYKERLAESLGAKHGDR